MRKMETVTASKIFAAAAIAVAACFAQAAATVEAQAQSQSNAVTSQRSRYIDGVYTATGQYGGGPSFVTVTVTLKGGAVTEVQVKPHATVARSLELQQRFAAAVPHVVVGKPIETIKVGKLAGSSHTPDGFNAAIQQIRDQAKAR
jgi:uncharacterized protein with FMN-binding domain